MSVTCAEHSLQDTFHFKSWGWKHKVKRKCFYGQARTSLTPLVLWLLRFIFHGPISVRVKVREAVLRWVIKQSATNPAQGRARVSSFVCSNLFAPCQVYCCGRFTELDTVKLTGCSIQSSFTVISTTGYGLRNIHAVDTIIIIHYFLHLLREIPRTLSYLYQHLKQFIFKWLHTGDSGSAMLWGVMSDKGNIKLQSFFARNLHYGKPPFYFFLEVHKSK
jgi:hypothetical protein